MAEQRVNIAVENGATVLEGLFEAGRRDRNAIICHPHPLYGGDMHNAVVQAARQTFAALGWATLRFNFRAAAGVPSRAARDCALAKSPGAGVPPEPSCALAESPGADNPAPGQGDARDLFEVCKFMGSRSPGRIDLAGYSYGAWAIMEAVRAGLCPDSLILISPPLDFLSFEGLTPPETPTLITLGDRDDFCSPGALQTWLSTSRHSEIAVEILPDVDHFYRGAERELSEKIGAFLTRLA